MADGMTDAASKELIGSYNRLERAAMGVVPVQAPVERPAPPRPAARVPRRRPSSETRRLLFGRVRAIAVMVLALIGMAWWTRHTRHSGLFPLLSAAIAVSLPAGFIIWASLTHTPRRPVPRLPWLKRGAGPAPGRSARSEPEPDRRRTRK
jgi:hypothetical protein